MVKEEKLTGIQKAAILLITLGPDVSAPIIKKLPESDVQKITCEIAKINSVKPAQRDAIMAEFIEINKASDYIIEGGVDYAKSLLDKAFGSQRTSEILEFITEATQQYRPFGTARKADPKQLLNVIINEHPQTIALILCYLQTEKAAQILDALPENIQSEVARRIATMSTSSPNSIKKIEKVLESKLAGIIKDDMTEAGGIDTLADIMNHIDRETGRSISEALEKEDPEIAEKIKEAMFVFDAIVTLDDISIQRILREVEVKELALALKGCSEDVCDAIFRNQSKRASQGLKEDMEFLGPVRVADVEKAQRRIVAVIRRLEETGEIVMSRGGGQSEIIL
jgi:flagellar motor switch protein FliG